MTLHTLVEDRRPRPRARSVKRNGLLQLGWPHFWLLIVILGGGLAVMAFVLYAHLSSL
jgi:hypothetical protein